MMFEQFADYVEELARDLPTNASRIPEAAAVLLFIFGPWFLGWAALFSLALRGHI